MRRNISRLAGVAVLATLAAATAHGEETLTVVGWGGKSQQAMSETWMQPWAQKAGVKLVEDSWNGELGKIRSMVDTGDVTWDVINGDIEHAIAGCDEGFLEFIDVEKLGGEDHFLPGTVYECGIPTHIFAVIFGYDADSIPASWGSNRPSVVADLFDLAKFPGRRAIRKNPKWVLEPAMVADGVPVDKVYEALGSPGGIDRALAKLDTIKDEVVWWTSGAQPPQLLADGEVAIAQMYSTRLYLARQTEGKNFIPVWDGQTYAANSWVIPKGANKALAMQFLEYIVQPEIVWKITTRNNLGLPIKGTDQYVPEAVKPYLPTSPANLTNAVVSGEAWWADHFEDANERFQKWLAQ